MAGKSEIRQDTIPCGARPQRNPTEKSALCPVSVRAVSGVCPVVVRSGVRGSFDLARDAF